jgi:hypothetical protein
MAYRSDIPVKENLVRTVSGDLAYMQGNFEHMVSVASGLLADGSGGNQKLLGFLLGDATKYNRFRVYWNSSFLKISRNTGSLGSPSWQDVATINEGDGEGSAAFAYVVSGQTPTAAAHLATKGYVDGLSLTLSGLTDTDISGPTSGQILEWDGTDSWDNVDHTHTLNFLTDVTLSSPASGESLVFNGAQWSNASGAAGSQTLSGLTDTNITAPADGAALVWDDGTSKWIDGAAPAGTLSGLTDTLITSPSVDARLVWNGSAWIDADALNLNGLTDVSTAGAVSGQVLKYNGTSWIPDTDLTASGAGAVNDLPDLGDVSITSPSSGQVLTYTGAGWENQDATGGTNTLSGLTDTNITAPDDGAVLTWDDGTSKWIDGTAPAQTLSGLTDTTITAPVSGGRLEWSGSAWVDAEPAASGVGLVESFDVAVEAVASGDSFTISLYAFYPYDVKTVRGKTSNGTCDLTFKIESTAITGLSGITVSGTETGWDSSAAESVALGNTFLVEVDDATTCSGLLLSIKTERT